MPIQEDMFEEQKANEIERLKREFALFPDLSPEVMDRFNKAMVEIRDQAIASVSNERKARNISRKYQIIIRQTAHTAIGDLRSKAKSERIEREMADLEQSLKHGLVLMDVYSGFIDAMKREIELELFNANVWRSYRIHIHTREEPPYEYHFRGADVYVCEGPVEIYHGSKTLCVTAHSKMLTILLYRLRDTDPGVIGYMSKYEFYGRIAESVIELNQQVEEPSLKQTLLTAIMMAKTVIEDWTAETKEELERVLNAKVEYLSKKL